jgi:hypothetical protein
LTQVRALFDRLQTRFGHILCTLFVERLRDRIEVGVEQVGVHVRWPSWRCTINTLAPELIAKLGLSLFSRIAAIYSRQCRGIRAQEPVWQSPRCSSKTFSHPERRRLGAGGIRGPPDRQRLSSGPLPVVSEKIGCVLESCSCCSFCISLGVPLKVPLVMCGLMFIRACSR